MLTVKLKKANVELMRVLRTSERFVHEVELWIKLACVMSAAFTLGVMFFILVGRVFAYTAVGSVVVFFIFARVLMWFVDTVCCFSILAGKKAQDRRRIFAGGKYRVD